MGETGGNSLISDLTGLSEPMTKLIEVISNGIGIAYEPIQKVLMAKAKSYEIKTLTDATKEIDGEITIKNGDYEIKMDTNSVEGRSLKSLIAKEVKKQVNIESIICKASEFVKEKESVSEEEVNQDWITRFFDIVQNISDEEMQNLWAKILSDEIEKPKLYSLRTLDVIKNITSDEGKMIQKVLQKVFTSDEEVGILFYDKNWLKSNGIEIFDVLYLEEIGIFSAPIDFELEGKAHYTFKYFNKKVILQNNSQEAIDLYARKLTRVGIEICRIIDSDCEENFLEKFKANIEKNPDLKVYIR